MKSFSTIAALLAVSLGLVACKGMAPSSGSEAKESTASNGSTMPAQNSMNNGTKMYAYTFVDPARQAPVMMNLEFSPKKPFLNIEYRVQRPGEAVQSFQVVADEVECSEGSCRYFNDEVKVSFVMDAQANISGLIWQSSEISSEITMRQGAVNLLGVSCDTATGMGCYP